MGIMITYHEYSNGYNNLMYNAHKNVDVHYTWQNMGNFNCMKSERSEEAAKGKFEACRSLLTRF